MPSAQSLANPSTLSVPHRLEGQLRAPRCSVGAFTDQGSFKSVARANAPSQHETGSMPLVLRMLLGGTGHVAPCVELGVCLGVQSA